MSQTIEDKDKKIADLRSLLVQAKSKIEQYKAQLIQKEKETEELKKNYEKKTKMLEGDSENIIKQYEQRLLRYQKTLEDSNQLIQKHQKGMQQVTKSYEELIKKISGIYTVTNKIFYLTPSKDKDSSDAVQQLVQLQKCKQFMQSMEKFGGISDLECITKMLSLLVKNNQMSLNKRREQRLQFVKKETSLGKMLEEEKQRSKHMQTEVNSLKRELEEMREKYDKNIESIAKNRAKMQEQKTNDEFVKQLLIKVIVGPKDASVMAFGILCKVLKLSEEETKLCQKKLK